MKILEEVRTGKLCWVDSLENSIKKDVYTKGEQLHYNQDGELALPFWINLDITEQNFVRVKRQHDFLESNLRYIQMIGADYNYLIKYMKSGEAKDKEALKKANEIIVIYAEFLKEILRNDKDYSPFDDNENFVHSKAERIYNYEHQDFYDYYYNFSKKIKKKTIEL
jgi:hypothetical protein